ncbi:hypothetical protein LJB42_001784 [Komagataella kurtzmanii]|nr:hypothetical protein LJB42_001784 [Komagataella kurtzmanii]
MDFDDLQLSASTLAALQEFKQEEEGRRKQFEDLSNSAQADYDKMKAAEEDPEKAKEIFSIDNFQEDWGLSQFWYSDSTADTYARTLFDGADADTVICVVSAPSVYSAMRKIPRSLWPTEHVYLLEYDIRFKILAGDEHFFFFDYKAPENLPPILLGKVGRLLIDPPFLGEDCQVRCALTTRALLSGKASDKLISSTGQVTAKVMKKIYPECSITDFEPEHKNGLSNEFSCYASFECDAWKFVT